MEFRPSFMDERRTSSHRFSVRTSVTLEGAGIYVKSGTTAPIAEVRHAAWGTKRQMVRHRSSVGSVGVAGVGCGR
jgi:hypothetical protein